MVTAKYSRGLLQVRLHRMFALANFEVWTALALYLQARDRQASAILNAFVAENLAPGLHPQRLIVSQGIHYDLATIFQQLNEKYFHNGCQARIGWGRSARRHYRRSIQLGIYNGEEKTIIISSL